jgi:hypothetical protein
MAGPITFVTPSFSGDYERFAFQRESMARCSIDVPHVAIVHDEDVDLFRSTPFRDSLTIVSSREVLPAEVERRRRERSIIGWRAQQLVKIAAAGIVDTDYVCVDSDTFWVRPITADDFYAPSGDLYLFEYRWCSAELLRWLLDSLEFWGVARRRKIVTVSYVRAIVPLALQLVRDLKSEIEHRYEADWWQAMLDHDVVEYMTYGVYARYVRGLRGLVPSGRDYSMGYWEAGFPQFDSHFPAAVSRGAKAGLVHSHLRVSPTGYRGTVERVWRELGY